MITLLSHIQEEYERWAKAIAQEDPYKSARTIGMDDVLRAHFLLIDYFTREGEGYGGVGPRDPDLLHSALSRQFTGFGQKKKWKSKHAMCATLFFGLIMDHPFHDCNKRTAFLVLLYHLLLLGRWPDTKQRDFETLAVRTADHRLSAYPAWHRFADKSDAEVRFIADYLKRNTRNIDKRYYTITYNDLQRILKGFGCRLNNPHANKIDVEQLVEQRRLLGKRKREFKRVGQIGFPGWTRQVGKGAINTVRSKTGLIPENGYDSKVFFKGVDPMPSLIDEFRGPLERLADR